MADKNGVELYERCDVKCPFFPDMTCNSQDWEYDDNGLKIRKTKTIFCCSYDGHPINWSAYCPRNEFFKKHRKNNTEE